MLLSYNVYWCINNIRLLFYTPININWIYM